MTDSGKVTASVAKGVFRFITGKIARKKPEDMTVRLPTATIGIRGTIVAGAVRTEAGDDPSVDNVFAGLKGTVPDSENARDFVVLLGPGNENNTNDRGGAFVFAPRPLERAGHGLSAGAPPPGTPGGGVDLGGVTVSRTGTGVVGFAPGRISPPFPSPPAVTQGFTDSLSAQPASGAKGSSGDSNAQEANSASDADNLSGNTIAETIQVAEIQTDIEDTQEAASETDCPTCGSGGGSSVFTTLAEVTAITTGNNQYNIPSTNIAGAVSGTYSGTVFLDFATQELIVNASGSYSGDISGNFSLNATESFQEASTNGLMQGFFDSAIDPELNVTGQGQVIAGGIFLNDQNGTAGSLAHSVTVINDANGVIKGTGSGLVAKQ